MRATLVIGILAGFVCTSCEDWTFGRDGPSDAADPPRCGNGVIEPGESCDGDCPTSCDDDDPCTDDILVGSAATCDVACSHQPVTRCVCGDGCCPPGCHADTDADCEAVCGNGVIEPGETCDGDCPTSCDDGNPCTSDSMTGSPAGCDVGCAAAPVADGTPCGSDLVCSTGRCQSCTVDTPCVPANPCHMGSWTCAAGPSCVDTGANAPDGSRCGSDLVCLGGACVECEAGVACATNPSRPCLLGETSCETGTSVCVDGEPAPEGTPCEANRTCHLVGGCCGGEGEQCATGGECCPSLRCIVGQCLTCSVGLCMGQADCCAGYECKGVMWPHYCVPYP